MKNKSNALHFPCSFPIKVMGLNNETFSSAIRAIVARHVVIGDISYSSQPSSGDKYMPPPLNLGDC